MSNTQATVLSTLIAIFVVRGVVTAAPQVPVPADVHRYEREAPVFKSKGITSGAELLGALKGGQSLRPWLQGASLPAGTICVLSVPARWWMKVWRADGSNYELGFSPDGGLVYLPDGLYIPDDATRSVLRKLLTKLEDDLTQECVNEKKPCSYCVGTAGDGGTLSGIARLFYDNANRWKTIFDANRQIINDPNVINGGMVLTIPSAP